jgi:NADH dehydrogenase FAD-containing subunit
MLFSLYASVLSIYLLPLAFRLNVRQLKTESDALEPWKFKVAYDKLVFAWGAEASTFGIRGVTDHAIFLREVHHAQEIRKGSLI